MELRDIFNKKESHKFHWNDLDNIKQGRSNLGEEMPVLVYRLMEYTLRETLEEELGREAMIHVFREAGEKAGKEFALHELDLDLELNVFISQLQKKMLEFKIGLLRVEQFDPDTGHAVLTVGEDLDCSGLPVTGETVCNYDEGFIAGIFKEYTKKKYVVTEIDCWATGDRVCRFEAKVEETKAL